MPPDEDEAAAAVLPVRPRRRRSMPARSRRRVQRLQDDVAGERERRRALEAGRWPVSASALGAGGRGDPCARARLGVRGRAGRWPGARLGLSSRVCGPGRSALAGRRRAPRRRPGRRPRAPRRRDRHRPRAPRARAGELRESLDGEDGGDVQGGRAAGGARRRAGLPRGRIGALAWRWRGGPPRARPCPRGRRSEHDQGAGGGQRERRQAIDAAEARREALEAAEQVQPGPRRRHGRASRRRSTSCGRRRSRRRRLRARELAELRDAAEAAAAERAREVAELRKIADAAEEPHRPRGRRAARDPGDRARAKHDETVTELRATLDSERAAHDAAAGELRTALEAERARHDDESASLRTALEAEQAKRTEEPVGPAGAPERPSWPRCAPGSPPSRLGTRRRSRDSPTRSRRRSPAISTRWPSSRPPSTQNGTSAARS